MQVLVVLAEQPGVVVSRETLFERCWGGVYVGEDSLNRVIGSLRRLSIDVARGSFEIETITRTGYRLIGKVTQSARASSDRKSGHFTRRELAGGSLGVVALGAIGGWAAVNDLKEKRFEQLLRQADKGLAGDDQFFRPDLALRAAEEAVRIHPDSARAFGWLALSRSYFAQVAPPSRSAEAVNSAVEATQKALAIDPQEPNALLALFEVQGSALDWWSRDRLLRRIIALRPVNTMAIGELASLLQAAGLTRESWGWNERHVRTAPLSPVLLGRRAQKLWIFGRVAAADNVIEQLRVQFPASAWVWSVRFILYAFTDRPAAAREMLEADPKMIAGAAEKQMWQACLDALEQRSNGAIANARQACLAMPQNPGGLASGGAVMVLSALGDLDTAFEIANGYLLGRGKTVRRSETAYGPDVGDALHRIDTYWLFMPPCRAMRADRRFLPLCAGVGLVEYWRRRAIQPDYMRVD